MMYATAKRTLGFFSFLSNEEQQATSYREDSVTGYAEGMNHAILPMIIEVLDEPRIDRTKELPAPPPLNMSDILVEDTHTLALESLRKGIISTKDKLMELKALKAAARQHQEELKTSEKNQKQSNQKKEALEQAQLGAGQRAVAADRAQSRTARPVSAKNASSTVGRSTRRSVGNKPRATSSAATSANTGPCPRTATAAPVAPDRSIESTTSSVP